MTVSSSETVQKTVGDIPLVGFATNLTDAEEVYKATKTAIENGYRLVDCSPLNQESNFQESMGRAIQECIKSGTVKREELVIVSKLWNTQQNDVKAACEKSLEALGLEHIDVFVMSWPVQQDSMGNVIHSDDRDAIAKTYKEMEQLVAHKLVNHLAVAHFSTRQLADLLEDSAIAPVANMYELNLEMQQQRLVEFCRAKGIQSVALNATGAQSTIPAAQDITELPDVARISKESGLTPTQVIHTWTNQMGATVLTNSMEFVKTDMDALTVKQHNDLLELDAAKRAYRVPFYNFPDDKIDLSLKQPKLVEGLVDEAGVYRNRFHRPGKYLDSHIIIENGAVRNLAARAKEYIPKACHDHKCFLITDEIVDGFYGDKVLKGFNDAGIETYKLVVPADALDETGNPSTERHKTLAVFSNTADEILKIGITKKSCIISLGGGVVNNLCGFLAASLYRGITLVHITTNMMGMADAAIDFKQACNHPRGKNLLGAYYPATNIVMDPEVLQTCSKRHILNGIAEALKHALCQSRHVTETIVRPLEKDLHGALRDPIYLEKLCRECIDHKVPTLCHYHESDFNEMVPQYGHAICHAVEHLSFHSEGIAPLLHGEAVAIGMCCTIEVSKIMGFCDQKTVDEHYAYVAGAALPCFIPDGMDLDDIQYKLTYDKHFVKKPTMGLIAEIGHMYCQDDGTYAVEIENDVIRAALEANVARRNSLKTPPTDLYTLDAANFMSKKATTPLKNVQSIATMKTSASSGSLTPSTESSLTDDAPTVEEFAKELTA